MNEELKESMDELREEKERRARRYGIAPKEGAPLTPPKGYPENEEDYGDPVNYKYPIDEGHIRAALTYFNREDMQKAGKYTDEEWAIIGRRIASAASRLLGRRYVYRDGKVVLVEAHSILLDDGTADDVVRVAGYAAVFGERDLVGDTFTPETDFWLDKLSPPARPLLYEHGFHPAVRHAVIGNVSKFETDDVGVWIEAELDRHSKYLERMLALIRAGVVGLSTGAAGHLVQRKTVDGKSIITEWPIFEVSLTLEPAEPRTLGVTELRSLGIPQGWESELMREDEARMDDEPGEDGMADQKSITKTEMEEKEMETVKLSEDTISALVAELSDALNQPATRALRAVEKNEEPFKIWLRTGTVPRAMKAEMIESTDSRGGYLVPDEYANELSTAIAKTSLMRKLNVANRSVNTDRYRWPTMSFTTMAVITGEGSAYNEAEPTFGEIIFTPFKFTRIAKVSEELLDDSRFDIWRNVLLPDFGQAFAKAENHYFINGTGSSQPQGILAGGTLGATAASASAITSDDVIELYHALAPEYRDEAVWIMNDSTAMALRQLKDSNGQYLWQPGLAAGTPDTLLGRPVFLSSDMPVIAAGAKVIAFMNPLFYGFVERAGLTMARLDELFASSGYVGFVARARWDGRVLLPDAVKYLQMATV